MRETTVAARYPFLYLVFGTAALTALMAILCFFLALGITGLGNA